MIYRPREMRRSCLLKVVACGGAPDNSPKKLDEVADGLATASRQCRKQGLQVASDVAFLTPHRSQAAWARGVSLASKPSFASWTTRRLALTSFERRFEMIGTEI